MEIYDLKFDDGKGDADVNLEKGVLEIKITEANDYFPANVQLDIPLDKIFEKLEAQAPNLLVKWGEKAAQALVDGID